MSESKMTNHHDAPIRHGSSSSRVERISEYKEISPSSISHSESFQFLDKNSNEPSPYYPLQPAVSRSKMLENQREAALRRRKQQLQSGLWMKNSNGFLSENRTSSDPHVTPAVRTFGVNSIAPSAIDTSRYENNISPISSGSYANISSWRQSQYDRYPEQREVYNDQNKQNIYKKSFHVEVEGYENSPRFHPHQTKYEDHNSEKSHFQMHDTSEPKKEQSCHYTLHDKDNHSSVLSINTSQNSMNTHSGRLSNEETNMFMAAKSPKNQEMMSIQMQLEENQNDSKRSITQSISQNSMDLNSREIKNTTNKSSLSNCETYEKICETELGNDENRGGNSEAANIKQSSVLHEINWDDINSVKKFLMSAVPKSAGMVECYVKRHKGLTPEYRVYLKEGDKFLMSSKKRPKKQSSNYIISTERNAHEKTSASVIGKLRANFLGTEYQIFDTGRNPKRFDPFYDEKNADEPRTELGVILYDSNLIGNRGPRKMQVCINKVDADGMSTKRWQPTHKDEEMIQCFKSNSSLVEQHLICFRNRLPRWNEDMAAFVLNFNGRVKLASIKNFQLTDEDDNVIMQFGRISKDEFTMDFKWPISPFQAFGISLSSCDSKLACD